MLGELETKSGRLVVADLEQGVGTVSRLGPDHVDLLLLVVEPHVKSLETARRARKIAEDLHVPHVVAVANRALSDEDVDRIREALPGLELLMVPDDPAIRAADREGAAPIDHSPESPAVRAIERIADALLAAR